MTIPFSIEDTQNETNTDTGNTDNDGPFSIEDTQNGH